MQKLTSEEATSRRKPQVPFWLKRLDRVRDELKGTRWPKGQEGFEQMLALMALGLRALEDEARTQVGRKRVGLVENRISKHLASFAKTDWRWIRRWQKERAKFFSR